MHEGSPPLQEHQLDYDWRFTEDTIARLADHAESADRILLAGCPSLAYVLGKIGRRGQLVERNPNYGDVGENFSVVYADLRFDYPMLQEAGQYDQSFIDPPWYPQELLRWVNFGLSQLRQGGALLFTLWPESVRPSARDEHRQILKAMSDVGRLEILKNVTYQLPFFERRSLEAAGQHVSKREGLLLRLTKANNKLLEVAQFQRSEFDWLRFTLSSEQLAILTSSRAEHNDPSDLFDVEPFILANTSRRNAQLAAINIWTSKNGVARLARPAEFAKRISARDPAALGMLVERMEMDFDPVKLHWGKTWQHPA